MAAAVQQAIRLVLTAWSGDDDAFPLAADPRGRVRTTPRLSENSHQGVSAENHHPHRGCEAGNPANALGKSPAVRWERGGACCTGRENDGTGLYFYRARYYSPTYQRFIAQDPIGFKGGDANLYAYVHDSPPVLTDPFGTCGGTPQNRRCNPFFLTYETALYIGYDTFKGFGYGGAIGLGTGLIVGVPEVGGLLGAGLGTIGGSAYGAYQAIQNIETDCQF